MVIEFRERLKTIPRSEKGDPAFKWYGPRGDSTEPIGLLDVFTTAEVVEIVNRYLYYYEYQRNSHKNFNQRRRDKLAPVKAKVREMFHVGWDKATPEQIEHAVQKLKEETK